MGADERHYNVNNLNRLFAIASVILLSALGLLFLSDYVRKWKDYQNDFQALEIEKTRVKYDEEINRIRSDPEYLALEEAIKTARTQFAAQCSDAKFQSVHSAVEKLRSETEVLNQRSRVRKAELDAAKFRYEEAIAKGGTDVKSREIKYKSLDQEVKQLSRSIEQTDFALKLKTGIIDECEQSLTDLEKKKRSLAQKAVILDRKLKKIDPNAMDMTNRLANLIRNLPVIDLSNPTFKVKQVVLNDIRDDVNFMTVPKVDRCVTCHLGIDNPDYKDAAQPLRSHPDLELYLSKDSAHPLEDFGCTVCHNGRGRGTDFISAAHTPSSEEQKEEWETKYQWEELHHWDKPMYPKPYTEAGCFKCHSTEGAVKGAEKLTLGLSLIERAGCYACHTIEKYKDWPKPGPSLTRLASKSSPDWTHRWLADPKAFRHNTWMPSFFNPSNTSDPESMARANQEIHAIVSYLFSESEEFRMNNMPSWGDPKNGEELVASIGCFGCHNRESVSMNPRTVDSLKREQGPNLTGFGDKTSKVWLYEWLRNPKRYHPGTRMPDLRLTDKEAADIAAFLAQDKNAAFSKIVIPPVDEKILDQIVEQFLRKTSSSAEAQARLQTMAREEKSKFAGQKLIAQYGCFSCHDIKGFDGYKPIGTDLTGEGSKDIHKFDFGFAHIDHTKEAWFEQKLKDPRVFDQGKIKTPDEKLLMPNFQFTDEEAEAITTALLGFVKDKPAKVKPRTPGNLAIEQGQRLVRQYNCQGCHRIEGEGGAIKPHVVEWLVNFQNREQNEAEAVAGSFSPPNLIGEGKKVQTQWLFDFLHSPEIIRPWLKVRMPTYQFSADELNAFLEYFNALDSEEFPFTEKANLSLSHEEFVAAEKLFGKEYFDCGICHIVGDKMPAGSPDSWAPNFTLAEKRLKPEWVLLWLKNPQAMLPGTKMPTFFDPNSFSESGPADILNGDEEEQIRVLRNYLMTISGHPKKTESQNNPQPVPVSP